MRSPWTAADTVTPDAESRGWVDRAPKGLRPYLRLARYDRPIGFWLLAIPCWAGMALAHLGPTLGDAWTLDDTGLALAFGLGAIAMRGAGCAWNDLLDRDLDAKVARTANRPLASGALGARAALGFIAFQLLVGLGVLLILTPLARIVALLALPLVALYPLMKRITWFPQAWLGLTFNWGALVGYAAVADALTAPAIVAFFGLAAWTFGYDTIYAGQDVEDDALIGVKSTARFFGPRARLACALAYGLAVALLAIGALGVASKGAALIGAGLGVSGFAIHLAWQIARVRLADPGACLAAFRSNRTAGLILVVGLTAAPLWFGLLR